MSDETPTTDPAFERLLAYLRHSRGFDFGGYKRTSLERRVRSRMAVVGVADFGDYEDFLEVHPDEFGRLFDAILINVTAFFRDPAVWQYLQTDVVPRLVADKPPDEPIRVWSAGCSSGEEAYTLAIVLAEALGVDAFHNRVKIYGTDVDEHALNQARLASYPAKNLEEMDPKLRGGYFESAGDRFAFRKDLRRNVIFGRHDLMTDAPMSRLDLLVCRNCLMYFNAEAQARIVERFHFAVADGGYLVLGKAEMLLNHGSTFAPVDLKQRVFRKVPRPAPRPRPWAAGNPNGNGGAAPLVEHVRLREAAFDTGPVAQVVIDANGLLVLANHNARALFGLTPQDLGRPFHELALAARPLDLRTAIEQVTVTGRPVVHRELEWRPAGSGEAEYLDVQVVPMRDHATAALLGVSVTFPDATQPRRLQEELRRTNADLEAAYEELQSANEELETTNEELQSTVEELETTNEELQSTNQELETMNEELQSANEELQTMNEELRQRTDELNQVNSFLESILAGFRGAVVVVDRDLVVLVWNHRAEDLWGLRGDEARGRHFLNLDIGLPVGELRQAVRDCLHGDRVAELTVRAVNRRGKPILCRVTSTPLFGPGREARGAILLMEEFEPEKAT